MSTIQIGILHSLSGTMSISEVPLVETIQMAISEINAVGGVLGRQIEPIVKDGASDPHEFERKARKLLAEDRVATVFGCWTSHSRKIVLPVFEEHNALLWYPVQYEGLEQSRQIFYTGACLNQQVEPAVAWLLANGFRRIYLIGSDYVFPRTANQVVKGQVRHGGAAIAGEDYFPLGAMDFSAAIGRIRAAEPDVVFNTLNGDSNLAFYRQYGEAGIAASDIPVMAVSIAEVELQHIGDAAVGHYACWCYFQSVDTPQNRQFVRNFRQRYGSDRVTSDPMASAYTQVYLWRQAVEAAGDFAVDRIRQAAYGQSFEAPCGTVKIEPNHHVGKGYRIGKALPNGQFEIVFCSEGQVKPLPWLGVETSNIVNTPVVIDLLSQVSAGFQDNWKLRTEHKERLEVQAKLEAANAELEALFGAMDQLIFVFDRHGTHLKIPAVNPKLQFQPDRNRIGKTLHEVFPKAIADQFLGYIQRALETEAIVNEEYSLELNGQIVWSDAGISPIDENSVVWVVRDVTKRKQMEDDLLRASAEIAALNKRLLAENSRMSAELEITRQIQQMILPKEHELDQIPSLEIAGFMEPASEVGGDYYDVLFEHGGVTIGIGDVTGHGLESGVLAIMVQTAVRTLLAHRETDPVKFLSVLNRVIYQNVQRMNSSKNLSLSLLDYKDGKLRLSGQHEETVNEMRLDAALIQHPLTQADPGLSSILDRHAEALLARLPQSETLIDSVNRLMSQGLRGGDPSLTAIARQLGYAPRTLQRKLQEAGTSYHTLLDEMRRELSIYYLREAQIAVSEVAFLLGFSETSAFHRAFRRWMGVAPGEFRRSA